MDLCQVLCGATTGGDAVLYMHWERVHNPQCSQLCMWEQYDLVKRGCFLGFFFHVMVAEAHQFQTNSSASSSMWSYDSCICLVSSFLLVLAKKNKLVKTSWHVSWLVWVPLRSCISTFVMAAQDKTAAAIPLCFMSQSLNNFISRLLPLVRSCGAVVDKASGWEGESWRLLVVKPLRTSLSPTEPRLRANCAASLHIGVDEVLVNRCRLLDIHAWQVSPSPWQCSLPVCLDFKPHPDKIKMESCWEMITSPRINEPESRIKQRCCA